MQWLVSSEVFRSACYNPKHYPFTNHKPKQYGNSVDSDDDKMKNDNNYNGHEKNDKMTTIMTIVVAEVTKATKVTISDRNDNDNNRK